MVHNIKLPLVNCLYPAVIHLDHGCGGAVPSPETVVVRVKQLIGVHLLHYLDENGPLNDFAENTEDCNRPVVLGL